MIKYPSRQVIKETGLDFISTDNLEQAYILLESCQPQIVIVENRLLEDINDLIILKQNMKNSKIIILGDTGFSGFMEDINCIPSPINYTRLASQLNLFKYE